MQRTIITILTLITLICSPIATNADTNDDESFPVSPHADLIESDIYFLASDDLEGRLAGSPGAETAADYIASVFSSLDLIPADTTDGDYFQEFEITVEPDSIIKTTWNVAGIIPGSDPDLRDEYVIIGAHYDHIGWGELDSRYDGPEPQIHNGADDNASGTTGVLELARMFASAPVKPSRSILFICFSAEEMGLLGSKAYIENPLVPIDSTIAMINMDMIGRVSPGDDGDPFCMIMGINSADEWIDLIPDFTPDGEVKLTVSALALGSDHVSFYGAQIPAINFFSGAHDDYNMPSDDAELINYEGMVSVIGAVYEIASEIAELPEKLIFIESERSQSTSDDDTPSGPPFTVYLGTVPDFTRTEGGFWISGVSEGSPAEAAGLIGGDQILKLDDFEITDVFCFTKVLGEFEPGDTVEILVLRDDEEIVLTATFGSRG